MLPAARACFLLTLLIVLLFPPARQAEAQYAASPLTQFSMHSDSGDYIGQGRDYLFNANDGNFTTSVRANSAGKAAYVTIQLSQGLGGEGWSAVFSSQALGTELVPGVYNQAERAPFADNGRPGLEISGDGRGSNTLTGKFTVTEAVYDYSSSPPRLVRFAANFEQHSEGGAPALTGTIYYNSNIHPQIPDTSHPDTSISLSGTFGKYGRYVSPVQATLAASDPDGISDVAAVYYTLDGGTPQIYSAPFTVSSDGIHSIRYYSIDQTGNQETAKLQTVWIDTSPATTASARTRLTMHSQSGDYIGQGQDYLYTDSDGQFSATATTTQPYGQTGAPVNTVHVSFNTPGYGHWWYLDFSTSQLGTPISVGTYEGAMREAFTASGHPGLEVSGDGRGSNTLTGKFTVLDLVLDYSTSATQPQIVSFAATFEQHSEGAVPALTGTIYYHSTAYAGTPETVTFSPSTVTSGGTAVGTVTLATPAPTNGEVVMLSSSDPGASVPTTVMVPSGALSATFPVTTTAVSAQTRVSISASANGVTGVGTLTVLPLASWMAASLSVGPDGNTHLLWDNADGRTAVWSIDGGYGVTSSPIYQPGGGWSAKDVSADGRGISHILWTNPDGRMAVWTVDGQGNASSLPIFQPGGGWNAQALSMDGAGSAHVLWVNTDGRAAVWTITPQGQVSSTPYYQPGSGWTAQDISEDSQGKAHVLWVNTDGRVSVWTIDGNNGVTSTPIYQPGGGWVAKKVSVDGSGSAHILWTNPDGRMTVWTVDGQGNATSLPIFQPGGGWAARGLAVDGAGNARVLWANPDGRTAVWTITPQGQASSTPIYQP